MADNTVVQTSFLGGEWSPLAQGQVDNPNYHKSLALCSNAVPLEEGAWVRRSGTCHGDGGGYTNRGYYAKSFQFPFGADSPYTIEISFDGSSSSYMTFWKGADRVTDSVQTLDNSNAPTGSPATFTTTANLSTTGWNTGDDILVSAGSFPVTNNSLNGATLLNRVFTITKTGAKTFTMVDAVTGAAVNASSFTYDNTVTNVFHRVTKNTCPYTSAADVSITTAVCVYDGTPSNNVQIVLLNQNHAPIAVEGFYESLGQAGFVKTTPTFTDGPYVPQEGGALTLGGASGTVSFSHAGALINNGAGFASNDVGRTMRIMTIPPVWASGTAYNAGDVVTLQAGVDLGDGSIPYQQSTYWTALVATTGNQPDQSPIQWAPYGNGVTWTWATITTVSTTSTGTLTIVGPAIPNYAQVNYWQMDYFNWFWGWPSGGLFFEGRLWLHGVSATEGRFDGSMANQNNYFIYSPTDQYGNVGDANAISYTITDPNPSNIMWMAADPNGIVIGRQHDEWTLRPGTGTGAITPTNISAKRASGYGTGYLTQPVRAGAILTFIDRTYRRVMELVSDTFSNKLTGRVLNEYARHLGRGLFKRATYQDSTVPIIWAIDFAGKLFGCCYRRIGTYATQPPEMQGWHKHTLGTGWTISDIAGSSNFSTNSQQDQSQDLVYLSTFDGTHYHMEVLQQLYDTETGFINGWFLDCAPTYVVGRDPALDSSSAGITFYGLQALNGLAVRVFIAGLDFGTQTVSSSKLTVSYAADPEGLGTAAYLQSKSGTYTFGCPLDLKISGSRAQITVPVVIGMPFLSEGQMLRPANGPDIALTKGTGLGKIRRDILYAALMNDSAGGSFGTTASNALPIIYRNPAVLGASASFSGVQIDGLNDPYSLDGQLYWSSSSVYPMNVVSVTTFLQSGER